MLQPAPADDRRPSQPDVDVERAIERLYEDESLAGSGLVTDRGLGPLLAAVVRLGSARSGWCESTGALASALRRLARGSVAACEQHDLGALSEVAVAGVITPMEAALASANVVVADDPDDTCEALARFLNALAGDPPAEDI